MARILKGAAGLRAELADAQTKPPAEHVALRTSYQDLIDAIDRFTKVQGMGDPVDGIDQVLVHPRAPAAGGAFYSDDILGSFLHPLPLYGQQAGPFV